MTFPYSDVVYRLPIKQGACAVDIGGSTKFHERCQCSNSDVSICKQHCDSDQKCLGYVGPTKWNACQFATTSECPSGCSKYDKGHTGHLLMDEELSYDNYPGCFVKVPGSCIDDMIILFKHVLSIVRLAIVLA